MFNFIVFFSDKIHEFLNPQSFWDYCEIKTKKQVKQLLFSDFFPLDKPKWHCHFAGKSSTQTPKLASRHQKKEKKQTGRRVREAEKKDN